MTFARVNPLGWATNSKLTSAQLNQLDIDHANALDKTGDSTAVGSTITHNGTIAIGNGGAIVTGGAGIINQTSNSTTTTSAVTLPVATIPVFSTSGFPTSGTVYVQTSGGLTTVTYTGVTATSFTGCSGGTGSVANGAQVFQSTVQFTSSAVTFTGGTMSVGASATMLVTGAGSLIQTQSGGRIQLGDGDYPTFSASRQYNRVIDLAAVNSYAFGSGSPPQWGSTVDGLLAPSAIASAQRQVYVPLQFTHNGATIGSITLYFTPAGALAGRGGVNPQYNISATLATRAIATNGVLPSRNFYVGLTAYAAPVYATYTGGTVQTLAINTSAVVDNTTTEYALVIGDEWGTSAVGQTTFHQAIVNYTTIADMRFP